MNSSMYSADRLTHVKIVVVSLLCGCLVAGIGTLAHVGQANLGSAPIVVKAGQPTIVTGQLPVVR